MELCVCGFDCRNLRCRIQNAKMDRYLSSFLQKFYKEPRKDMSLIYNYLLESFLNFEFSAKMWVTPGWPRDRDAIKKCLNSTSMVSAMWRHQN